MKRALVLHAMGQNSKGHWYPWIKHELEIRGYEVWVPDLPNPNMPNNREVLDMLLGSGWEFNDSLVIGHSSGAMQLLYLLQNLKEDIAISSAIMVSAFDRPVSGMEDQHKGLFSESYNYDAIQKHSHSRIFVHGVDDPWCPLQGARNLAQGTNSEIIEINNGGHFSTSLDARWKEFPELIDILSQRNLL